MINFWRLGNGLWAFIFMMKNQSVGRNMEQVGRFRRWILVEKLKMLVGVPLAYTATWLLLINPWPGYSLSEILTNYSVLPPLGLLFWLPIVGILVLLVMAAAEYTLIGAIFMIGWMQIRFFGYHR